MHMQHLVSFGSRISLTVHPVKQEGFDQDQQNQIQDLWQLAQDCLLGVDRLLSKYKSFPSSSFGLRSPAEAVAANAVKDKIKINVVIPVHFILFSKNPPH